MIKPWLWLPAQLAHAVSGFGVEAAAYLADDFDYKWKPFRWNGFEFRNPLGIAGGLDKNAEQIQAWQKLGAGFIEVGTVTPYPQDPNPGKIIGRDNESLALWNKMGFPSKGVDYLYEELRFSRRSVPLFVNIGKNRKTPNEKAFEDYVALTKKLRPLADVLVVNISSPNTAGLRDLFKPEFLERGLKSVVKAAIYTPVLLKFSPDMTDQELKETLKVAVGCGVAGFIMTNSTTHRNSGSPFPIEGGVSGKPLQQASIRALEKIQEFLGSERSSLLLVNCGGVMTSADVFDRLKRGADLVQVYSALVFNGPGFLKEVAIEWKKLKSDAHA
jgi:dihydroorotate dehydrogenase